MYLSKIEVIGFKSFAHRVEFNFDAGVTAIVGPNGCGKTNIVDAIRWALGEQRYSTLRSDKMEDVIFNGTKNRKPLGLAEVSLSIENTKGILPTEYAEVTITRRVFRSGESEYLLNKVPCRLKDILDLFMDTGMGSDAYSVIELKMVESILSDKTDERRRLFEEAAGVTKYKHRRKAAIRKLEEVQTDLERVNDIVKEVQKTVNSLERQAKKAEQFNEVSARLKSLELDLLEREYAYNHNKLQPLMEKFQLAQADKSVIDDALRQQEDKVDELRNGLRDIERELLEAQRSASAQFELIRHAEERMLVANERLSSLRSNIRRFEIEKEDLHRQSGLLTREHSNFLANKEQHGTELKTVETSRSIAGEEARAASRQLEVKKNQVQTLKDELLGLAHEIVEKRGERERLRARIDNLSGRRDRSLEDTAHYENDIRRNQEQIADLTVQDRELRRMFVAAESELFEAENQKQALKERIDHLQRASLNVRNEIERQKSRMDFLKNMVESNEGYSEGVRYLLGNDRWKQRKLATIAETIHAKERYRKAVEAALGELAGCLIVERVEDGREAVAELTTAEKGKATFLCLEWVPEVVRRGRAKSAGLVWASEIIDCEPQYRALIAFLFEDVAIVESFADAARLASSVAGVRCVTLDGHILGSGGLLRGGSHRLDEGGLIWKKGQIAELQAELIQHDRAFELIANQMRSLTQEHQVTDLKAYSDKVKAVEKEMTAVEMRIAQLEFEKKRANDGIERSKSDIEILQEEIQAHKADYEKCGEELTRLENLKNEHDGTTTVATHEFDAAELQASEKTKAVSELEIRVVTLQGDSRNIERDIERAEARMEDIRTTLVRRDEEIGRARDEIGRLAAEVDSVTGELTRLRAEFQSIETAKHDVEQHYSTKRNELHQIELKIKDERRLHDDALSAAHDLEMKISELRSAMEHVRLRAQEEFDVELRLHTYPDDEFVDFAHLRDEVKNLKERIRILGAINFAAFDEFTTESERLTFMTQQRDDLLEAEKTLLSTIEEINATAQRMFSETFGKIRANFITIFKELFQEGDECDLKIEEGVDPLEATIEIIAKPRGKRPTSIDLLSGGEKTLTAIALLFAIYLVKPSPFCILDEVDAPLDDSNIDRYTRILKKFSDNTQFIVVTHNKRTMEAAHALYGVTMEEEGISKIVTVRFNEEARVRSAIVTN